MKRKRNTNGDDMKWRRYEMEKILGDPEVTANIYCKSRNLPNKDTQNYSTDLL